jgi:hypothetical protein
MFCANHQHAYTSVCTECLKDQGYGTLNVVKLYDACIAAGYKDTLAHEDSEVYERYSKFYFVGLDSASIPVVQCFDPVGLKLETLFTASEQVCVRDMFSEARAYLRSHVSGM